MIVLDFTLFEMVHVYVYSICGRAPMSAVVKLRFGFSVQVWRQPSLNIPVVIAMVRA